MRDSTDGVFQVPKAQVLAMIVEGRPYPRLLSVKKAQAQGYYSLI